MVLYKWYILPIGGLYATYHLLWEPKTTIEVSNPLGFKHHPLEGAGKQSQTEHVFVGYLVGANHPPYCDPLLVM